MATLINGNGNAAVYAQQDADLYAGFKGNSTQILNVGSKLAATIEDSNTIAVADGVILTKEGRRIQVDVGNIDEFIIPTGQAGTTRYYIFGYHLYTDGSANQKCETFVQLMSDGSETITENTFRGGATEVYVSLYRVKQEGLTLGTPAALLSVCETVDEILSDIDGINASLTELELLWTNPNPSATTFAAQTIPLALSDYDFVMIDFMSTIPAQIIRVDFSLAITYTDITSSVYRYKRSVIVNPTNVEFADATSQIAGGSASTDNRLLIPYRIYGIKLPS